MQRQISSSGRKLGHTSAFSSISSANNNVYMSELSRCQRGVIHSMALSQQLSRRPWQPCNSLRMMEWMRTGGHWNSTSPAFVYFCCAEALEAAECPPPLDARQAVRYLCELLTGLREGGWRSLLMFTRLALASTHRLVAHKQEGCAPANHIASHSSHLVSTMPRSYAPPPTGTQAIPRSPQDPRVPAIGAHSPKQAEVSTGLGGDSDGS